jgi:hypothetical protein
VEKESKHMRAVRNDCRTDGGLQAGAVRIAFIGAKVTKLGIDRGGSANAMVVADIRPKL